MIRLTKHALDIYKKDTYSEAKIMLLRSFMYRKIDDGTRIRRRRIYRIFLLRLKGKSYKEIANRLGVTHTRIRQIVHSQSRRINSYFNFKINMAPTYVEIKKIPKDQLPIFHSSFGMTPEQVNEIHEKFYNQRIANEEKT